MSHSFLLLGWLGKMISFFETYAFVGGREKNYQIYRLSLFLSLSLVGKKNR